MLSSTPSYSIFVVVVPPHPLVTPTHCVSQPKSRLTMYLPQPFTRDYRCSPRGHCFIDLHHLMALTSIQPGCTLPASRLGCSPDSCLTTVTFYARSSFSRPMVTTQCTRLPQCSRNLDRDPGTGSDRSHPSHCNGACV